MEGHSDWMTAWIRNGSKSYQNQLFREIGWPGSKMDRTDTKIKNFERLGGLSPKFTEMVLAERPGSQTTLSSILGKNDPLNGPKRFGSKLFVLSFQVFLNDTFDGFGPCMPFLTMPY